MVRSLSFIPAALFFVASPAIGQQAAGGTASRMTGTEIFSTFGGMTMTGNYGNGINFTESYHPDGSITYSDDDGSDNGRWFTRGDLFCTFYDTYNGACYAVRQSGPNCFEYYTEEEEDGTSHAYEGAWNSVGWDRSKETTCDLTDKTS